MRNIDRTAKSDTVQFRYDGNNELKELLREELKRTFLHLEQKGPHTRVPPDLAEYVEFYRTGIPFVYRILFVKIGDSLFNL